MNLPILKEGERALCIYHAHCIDGFGAAMAIVTQYGSDKDVELYPGVYSEPPPDVAGRKVIIVDFSYPEDVLLEINEQAADLLIFDHHEGNNHVGDLIDQGRIKGVFDIERSGAGICWDVTCGYRPAYIDHIEDRDLWRWKLEHTNYVTAAIFSYPFEVEIWHQFSSDTVYKQLILEGQSLVSKHKKDVQSALLNAYMMDIAGYTVPVVNCPPWLASDVGHELCQHHPFSASYFDKDGTTRVFSLRSRDDGGANVFEIAQLFGGGGHRHAAGFEVSSNETMRLTAPTEAQ